MKRHMPPLNHLRAFEAAVRHESFTKAAEELGVTQGAISRHIRSLEDYLGFELFQRENNTLRVARETREFADALTRALDQINRGSQALKKGRRRTVLTVRAYTNFLVRWLIPRLPDFQAKHPDVEIRLSGGREEADFSRDDVDMDVRYGNGRWPGLRAELLFTHEMVPVANPALIDRLAIREPEDVLKATVYHAYSRKNEWAKWFALVSPKPFKPAAEIYTEDPTVAQQLVIAGLGIGISQRQFIQDQLASGELVVLFDVALTSDAGFYLVCPPDRLLLPKNAAFHQWMVDNRDSAPVS